MGRRTASQLMQPAAWASHSTTKHRGEARLPALVEQTAATCASLVQGPVDPLGQLAPHEGGSALAKGSPHAARPARKQQSGA